MKLEPIWAWLRAATSWLRRQELLLLASLALIPGGLWTFAEISEDVGEGDTRELDRRILIWMRAPGDLADPLGPPWLEEIGRDLTALGGVAIVTLTTVGVVGGLLIVRQRRAALLMAGAVCGGWLLTTLLKEAFERPRPNLVAHEVTAYSAAFPSGHTTMAAITYLTIAVLLAEVRAIRRASAYVLACATLLTLLVGTSRVYLGVHWPTDVLAGWAIGASWALLCWLITIRVPALIHGRAANDST